MPIREQLRQKVLNVLESHSIDSSKILDNLFEELLKYQMELEIQNIHLINAQNDLEESNKKYMDLYHLAPFGYFTLDEKGWIIEVNKIGEDLLQVDRSHLLNQVFSRYVAPDSQYIFSHFLDQAFHSAKIQPCELNLFKGGVVFTAKVEGKIINSINNKKIQLLIIVTNINDFKFLNRKNIIENSHAFTSVMTHELNQPLGVISNYLYGSIRRLESGKFEVPAIIQALKSATQQLDRTSELILKIKNIYCNEHYILEKICVDNFIHESISLIKSELYDFSLLIHYKPYKNIPKVMIDKSHIQLVILNLARNAIEAMRDANILHPTLTFEVNLLNPHRVEICLYDNGPGYSLEHSHRLFDSNFTTKSYGTGLGLAVSRSIIKSHGGTLISELNVVNGACFKFDLPVVSNNGMSK